MKPYTESSDNSAQRCAADDDGEDDEDDVYSLQVAGSANQLALAVTPQLCRGPEVFHLVNKSPQPQDRTGQDNHRHRTLRCVVHQSSKRSRVRFHSRL